MDHGILDILRIHLNADLRNTMKEQNITLNVKNHGILYIMRLIQIEEMQPVEKNFLKVEPEEVF